MNHGRFHRFLALLVVGTRIAGTGERIQAQEPAQGQVRQPSAPSAGQTEPFDISAQMQQLARNVRAEGQNLEAIAKRADDLLWYLKVSDLAQVDKIQLTSTKPIRMPNPTGQGAGNPLIIYGYTFTPKRLRADAHAPLLVFVHGGVHSNFDTSYAHIVRELVGQGYILIAPDYRGSTGYGSSYYEQIDYGGAEIDDVHAMRDWAVANLPVDQTRVGIIGWSHGGYITLLNIFRWAHDYKVAYAGCPVSDLVMRMGYKSQGYRDTFASFLGRKQAEDNPAEYRRRSPVSHAAELETPLLVHSNTNDEDVNVMEVQHLIDALKAAGKTFEQKIYQDAPGGHHFNRIDTSLARESRKEIYAFLAKYLRPE